MEQRHLPRDAKLGHAELDNIHDLVFEVIEKTLALPSGPFIPAFSNVVTALEVDFRREELIIESYDCPDAKLHREQHARMLAGLHHAASELLQGNENDARRALAALREWLPFHIATQDRHLVRALYLRGEGAQHSLH